MIMSTPEHFGLIVEDPSGQRRIVRLDSRKKVFGRWPPPHTDVQLHDGHVAKSHFEIQWNVVASTHEVFDYGHVYSPTVNGEVVRGDRLLHLADVLAIGQYTLQYVDLTHLEGPGERSDIEDSFRWPSDVDSDPVVTTRSYLDTVNSYDLRRILAAMSPGYRAESLLRVGVADRREDVVATLQSLFAAFPDFHVRVHEVWQVGTEVHVSAHLAGTFLKHFDSPTGSLAPNGERLQLKDQVFIFRCDGGHVRSMRWPSKDDAWSVIKAVVAGR